MSVSPTEQTQRQVGENALGPAMEASAPAGCEAGQSNQERKGWLDPGLAGPRVGWTQGWLDPGMAGPRAG